MSSVKLSRSYQGILNHLWKIEKPGIRLDLEAIKGFLNLLDNPHRHFPSILVAGTNGKGSTAAMVSEILSYSGYKTGFYSSPHLWSYRERIVIKKEGETLPFNERLWCENYEKLARTLEKSDFSLTQFEILTALCFLIFAQENVDIAVLEVGLGGRLDATNVVYPALSLLNIVDRDHQEFLGEALSSIAREKAGIMRKGRLAITVPQQEDVLDIFQKESFAVGAALHVITPGKLKETTFASQQFYYQGDFYEQKLLGEHQVINASLAIEAAQQLAVRGFTQITKQSIRQGIKGAKWPVRFEVISHQPVVILDGAHNPQGARTLLTSLQQLNLPKPHHLILGILEGKDVEGIVHELASWGDCWFLCQPRNVRGLSPQALDQKVRSVLADREIRVVRKVGEGCRESLAELRSHGTLCIAGSLSTAAEGRRLLCR